MFIRNPFKGNGADFILFFLGFLLEMVGYGEKLDYHDQPRSIKTKQDQPRSNQGLSNDNQSLALIALFHLYSLHPDFLSLDLIDKSCRADYPRSSWWVSLSFLQLLCCTKVVDY